MAAAKATLLSPKWLCFGLGFLGTAILAMFWMYPALLYLFGGIETHNLADGLTWSAPILLLALLMTGWFMLGFLALLRPELVIKILPEFMKKGVIINKPNGANSQFKHGRQFVLNSLVGRVLIWPATVIATLLFMTVMFASALISPWGAWLLSSIFQAFAFFIPALFILALLLRIFAPGIFSFINRETISDEKSGTGFFPVTAMSYIVGLMTALLVVMLMSITGLLPHPRNVSEPIQTTGRTNNGVMPNPAGNNPDTNPRDKETKRKETKRKETKRKDVSKIKWEQHFLELLGENHVPVAEAFSTPFATYFRIDQPGYIPSGKLGPRGKSYLGPIECTPDIIPKSKNNASIAQSARDADEATTKSKPNVATNPNCPRDLGELWSSGSYVYDGTGNQLAGFEFKDNTHAYVVKAANGSQFLVFPEGGFGPKDNPAVNKYVPRYVFIRNTDPQGNLNNNDVSKMNIKPYFAGAPDLPVLIDRKIISDKDFNGGDFDYLPNIDEIISALDKIKQSSKSTASGDIVIISRAALPSDSAEYKKRIEDLAREIKRSRQASNATFIHLGFLPQICNAPTAGCEILNRRSTIIYTSNSR